MRRTSKDRRQARVGPDDRQPQIHRGRDGSGSIHMTPAFPVHAPTSTHASPEEK
jgi:hypothetical protein